MTGFVQITPLFIANVIRAFIALCIVPHLLKIQNDYRKCAVFSVCTAIPVTVINCVSGRQAFAAAAEIIIIFIAARFLFKKEPRTCFFLIFFYELLIGLWDFIVAAGLGLVFRSESFLDKTKTEYLLSVFTVRIVFAALTFLMIKIKSIGTKIIPYAAILGMICITFISMQKTIDVNADDLTTWTLFSVLILVAIKIFQLRGQYDMEKEIAQLETEKAELLERDYRTLSSTYAANAKLYHDFHNHVEILHNYLTNGNSEKALAYIEDMRSPLLEITQNIFTGDEATDYLINSKTAFAGSKGIRVKTNIEFPRHTNIRSADMTAILGNLLDNAIEAADDASDDLRFITLTIRRINDMIVIKTENGCANAPLIADGELQTTKDNSSQHGWGLKSVQTAAERYDGTVVTNYENNIFRAVVTLSYDTVEI